MQVAEVHRPGSGLVRSLLLVAVLVAFGIGGVCCSDAHVDVHAEASVSMAVVVTMAVLARRELRRTGQGQRVGQRHLMTLQPVASATVACSSAWRGHPATRRGPPWGASRPSFRA